MSDFIFWLVTELMVWLRIGGFCQVPDYAWIDWWKAQVERVWDLSDILYLTFAQKGIDPLNKS